VHQHAEQHTGGDEQAGDETQHRFKSHSDAPW
jgi:hypothetical protein